MSNNKMGIHVLLNVYGCPQEILEDAKALERLIEEVIKGSDLSHISSHFHQFSPKGATGVVLLGESHLSIHTWPEHDSAAIDIFCCFLGEKGEEKAIQKAEKASQLLIEKMNPKSFDKKIVMR